MKKKIILVLLLVVILVIALAGCKKDGDVNAGDPNMLYNPNAEGMQMVESLDSYDIMKKAYDTYKNSPSYKMEIDFVFKANAEMGAIALDLYQSTYQKTIRNNGDFYDYYIVAGKGMSVPTGIGREFVYNATTDEAKARYIDSSKKIYLDDNKKVTANFDGVQWGKFNASNEDDDISYVSDKINKTKENFHQYNWLDQKYISNKTDKRVFKKDGKYYCTILINTMDSAVKENQPAVIQAIETSTGGNFSRFNDNTRMMAEIEEVNGSYRFTQFILMEDYSGVKESLGKVTIKASQYYWHKFSYGAANVVIPA